MNNQRALGLYAFEKRTPAPSPAASLISQVIRVLGVRGSVCGVVISLWFPGACAIHSPSCSFPLFVLENSALQQGEHHQLHRKAMVCPDIRKAVFRKCPAQRLRWKQLYSRDHQWPDLFFPKDIFAVPNMCSVLSLEDLCPASTAVRGGQVEGNEGSGSPYAGRTPTTHWAAPLLSLRPKDPTCSSYI